MVAKLKVMAFTAIVVGVLSPSVAGATPRYVTRRVSMGPRPDQYITVRVEEARSHAPYALTGQPEIKLVRRLVQRWAGSRFIGPVWTAERITE